MNKLAALVALMLPLLSHAAPVPQLAGDELVLKYFGDPLTREGMPKGRAFVDRETARAYMDGIIDLTEGRSWCDPRNAPTHEIHTDVVHAIATLSAERRKSNAAVLVEEALVVRYPCKITKGNR